MTTVNKYRCSGPIDLIAEDARGVGRTVGVADGEDYILIAIPGVFFQRHIGSTMEKIGELSC